MRRDRLRGRPVTRKTAERWTQFVDREEQLMGRGRVDAKVELELAYGLKGGHFQEERLPVFEDCCRTDRDRIVPRHTRVPGASSGEP